MRTTEVKRIRDLAWKVALHPGARRIEILEALKLIACLKGYWIPDINPEFLTDRQAKELRLAKSRIVENALRRREKLRTVNRKAYLKRRLRELEAGGVEGIAVTAELPEKVDGGNNGEVG